MTLTVMSYYILQDNVSVCLHTVKYIVTLLSDRWYLLQYHHYYIHYIIITVPYSVLITVYLKIYCYYDYSYIVGISNLHSTYGVAIRQKGVFIFKMFKFAFDFSSQFFLLFTKMIKQE